uniref:Putative secreted protein n=1 Tax=Anopheles darlingi TaxID=43151 RepID=A0A2M4DMU8_ANODA
MLYRFAQYLPSTNYRLLTVVVVVLQPALADRLFVGFVWKGRRTVSSNIANSKHQFKPTAKQLTMVSGGCT